MSKPFQIPKPDAAKITKNDERIIDIVNAAIKEFNLQHPSQALNPDIGSSLTKRIESRPKDKFSRKLADSYLVDYLCDNRAEMANIAAQQGGLRKVLAERVLEKEFDK